MREKLDIPEVMSPNELPIERAELGLPPMPETKMTVKTISATFEHKYNLGDFESVNIGVTAWADVDLEQDPAQAIDELQKLCLNQVVKQAKPVKRVQNKGGIEFTMLDDKYKELAIILNDALTLLQGTHDDNYAVLVERLNKLTAGE